MERHRWYILKDHEPVPVAEQEYFAWHASEAARGEHPCITIHVANDYIGKVHVSTVFLGMDHAWSGPPVLFETMVFGGALDEQQWRYCTWAEAMAGHAGIVAQVRALEAPDGH